MEIKLKTADNLAPVRNQMRDLIEPNSRVLDFGCGNGDLLFKLSSKIKFGLGIDQSKNLIDQAVKQKEVYNISNLDYLCETLGNNFEHSESYDYAIASLFFHVIPLSEAVPLLHKMRAIAETIIICALSRPETLSQKFILWLDQQFTGHYKNFKAYQKHGYMEGILAEIPGSKIDTFDTALSVVKIYKITA